MQLLPHRITRLMVLHMNARPFSACGAHDTSAQPRKKPNWRTGSAAMAVTDKANGGGYAAKLTVRC